MDIDAEDEGFFTLNVRVVVDGEEKKLSFKLDLYEVNSRYAALFDEHNGDPEKITEAAREYLTSKGVPPLSAGSLSRIMAKVTEEVETFKKKHGIVWAKLDLPASTEPPSTPAASPT